MGSFFILETLQHKNSKLKLYDNQIHETKIPKTPKLPQSPRIST